MINLNSHHKLIADINELYKFYDLILPELLPNEVYFISLSARKKYLTTEEQQEIKLGRTEMFERRIIKDREWNKFLRTIKKFETVYGSYTSKNGFDIPDKCLVVYININPSCVLKAYREFNAIYSEYMYELTNNVIKGNKVDNILYRIKKIENVLKTSIQKNRGVKHWVDIDCDTNYKDDTLILLTCNKLLAGYGIKNYVLSTKSGYHILIKRQDLNFDPSDICMELLNSFQEKYSDWQGEVIVNKNEMVPLPGCYQAGHLVKIIGD
jgi:hypothetical protein